jgi:hypothetical protein
VGLNSTANGDQQPPPSAADENGDEDQQPPPGSPSVAGEGSQPSAAQASTIEHHLPQEVPRRTRPRVQRDGRRGHGTNEVATADSPSSKRRRVERQVDGAGFDMMRRSQRERRPTKKATDQR